MREEFLDFYERERPPVERFLMVSKLHATRHDAEDGASDAFAQAWRLVTDGEWDRISNQRGWVRTVAYRACLNPAGLPRKTRGIQVIPTAPDDLIDLAGSRPGAGHAELAPGTMALLDALARLGDPQAAAVIALGMDGFTVAGMASILDVGEQRVRDLRKKAREHLKRHLAATTDYRREEVR